MFCELTKPALFAGHLNMGQTMGQTVAPRTVGDALARPPENLGLYKPDDRSFCGDLKKGDAIAGI